MRKDLEKLISSLERITLIASPAPQDTYQRGVTDLAIAVISDLQKIISKK